MKNVVVLTEKPDVAKDLSHIFSQIFKAQVKKENGFFRVNNFFITYAFGHLVEIDDTPFSGKWKLEELPLLPEKFSYRIIPAKKKQFSIIKSLLLKTDEVYIFTDAGREGELIARLILKLAGYKGKAKRFWTSEALTEEVVRKELKNMKDISFYDDLYYSALARQHADWIVGINFTRLATLKNPHSNSLQNKFQKQKVWSVGRVQTPVLKLLVDRENEIKNFKPEAYFVVTAEFEKNNIRYSGYLTKSFVTKNFENSQKAQTDISEQTNGSEETSEEEKKEEKTFRLSLREVQKIFEQLKKEKKGKITFIKKALQKEPPPLLYSLTSLQKDANRFFGFSLKKTHDLAQKLYEKYKCISYPRTDSSYLGEEAKPLVAQILKKLGKPELVPEINKTGKRVFDSSKLTDHHALIPLNKLPPNASEDEKKLYDLILRRFLCAFMGDFKYYQTNVITSVSELHFFTQGKEIVDYGWLKCYLDTEFYKEKTKEKKLPPLKEGDLVVKVKEEVQKKYTQPPPRYTEASLVAKMEKLNLGRPSTRDSIVETLLTRNYIFKKKKTLIPTEKAFVLVEMFKNNPVSSPEMTGHWETELENIYLKKQNYQGYLNFINKIKNFVKEAVKEFKTSKTTTTSLPKLTALSRE